MLNIIIILTTLKSCHSLVQPRKCCPPSQNLDTSDPTYPQCVKSVLSNLNLSVSTNSPARLPNCKAEYEVHPLGSGDGQQSPSYSWVGRNGALVTNKYGEDFEISDFCVDIDETSRGPVAVTCDACKEKVRDSGDFENVHDDVSDSVCQLVLPPWICFCIQP